ncbi:unnamed protein product [Kuraishia capsulata CBS 1993]|uniref:EXPERA domain-containing protein n=1 Tax=Kuraishia capsulata CBS 1993 TaxID=1382522 RepID=W6MJ40_9ASCO|nr:uncharacterized protein KUCA_T00002212001 [Kuraishia capsulata CBS 1993]CDK26241.1 unnamed protein product [Kuraishia capsulata CBS 1993]
MGVRQKLDKFYYYYFILHIPITVIIDSCLVIPPNRRLALQQIIFQFHIETNKDYLLVKTPDWLYYFGLFELVFQLPFFVYAVLNFTNGAFKKRTHNYIAFYGFNAASTTLCCLLDVWFHGEAHGLVPSEVYNLIGVYLPTFIIPSLMMVDYLIR